MKTTEILRLILVLALSLLPLPAQNWPGFRGLDSAGLAEGRIPATWNADPEHGLLRNILWSTPIPGLAHSSLIIWGDRIFVTSAVSETGNAQLRVGDFGAVDSADDS